MPDAQPNEALQLRPYQRDAIEAARHRFQLGDRATLVVLPTGAGKTVVFAEVARAVVERGGRVLVIAHRRELLEQAVAKLKQAIPRVTVALEQGAHRADVAASVVVGSVASLSRGSRLKRFSRESFRLVVVDEAHHAAADSYTRVLAHFDSARVLGFTATPDRGDRRKILGNVFDSIAYQRSILDLTCEGFLAPIRGRAVRVDAFDLTGARIAGADIDEGDIAQALGRDGVMEAIAELLATHAEGRLTLVFVAGVERAHRLAELLAPHGGAVAIDGKTATDGRAKRFGAFTLGAARFLVNVGIATEGTDIPMCSCVAIVRPTMSRPLFVQMVGRGTRLHPDKRDCLLLNFVPSNARHRLIEPIDALMRGDSDAIAHARSLAEREPNLQLHEVARQAQQAVPAQRRAARLGSYKAVLAAYDPFGLIVGLVDFELAAASEDASEGDRESLLHQGIPSDFARAASPGLAVALVRALQARRRSGLCSFRVARQLARHGLNPNVSTELGRLAMEALAGTRWRVVPQWLRTDPRFSCPEESNHAA